MIGDAAFVPRPHTAYGSAKAGVDADALATAPRDHGGDVDPALAAWEPLRWHGGGGPSTRASGTARASGSGPMYRAPA